MSNNKEKTYLFDFDGTLVDSMPSYVGVMLRILDERKIEYGEDIVKIITPLGYKGTAEYYRELGVNESVDELVSVMGEYARFEYENNIPAKSGVIDTLRKMKSRGYSLNVLTASPHLVLDPCLKRVGAWEFFDNVWSCEDFGTTKSDVKIYEMAAERLGQPIGDVIFVDDNINAVRTARESGIRAYGIYDASSADCVDLMRSVSERYVENFAELLEE